MPRALVSVSDKQGVLDFARGLAALGFEILSTGGTAKLLAEAGVPVRQVSDYTGFPEMLDGRVKTLHPKIHGGLLGRRDLPEHARAMGEHGIEPIDLVAVNLYPFRETIARPGTTLAEAIEQIDIGGPSMLRSAAKNHADVTVIVDPADYAPVLGELRAGGVRPETRRRLAVKVFCATACYDGAIADYLGEGATFHWGGRKALDMRYGENPHQAAALYGGIVVSTRAWTLPLARAVDEIFTEVLIAPEFEPDALELLRRKKARRLVRWHPDAAPAKAPALRSVAAGLLVQDADRAIEDPREARVVTRRAPTAEELRALAFAWRVVKHVKSNAIAFTTADRTLALGGGQTSRVEPVRNARARAGRLGISLRGSVLGSDAFFPFPDGLEEAIAAGATAVIQPGGSTRDAEVIAAADRHGVAMVFTGVRPATQGSRSRRSACRSRPTT